jgi:hypothetical protein
MLYWPIADGLSPCKSEREYQVQGFMTFRSKFYCKDLPLAILTISVKFTIFTILPRLQCFENTLPIAIRVY